MVENQDNVKLYMRSTVGFSTMHFDLNKSLVSRVVPSNVKLYTTQSTLQGESQSDLWKKCNLTLTFKPTCKYHDLTHISIDLDPCDPWVLTSNHITYRYIDFWSSHRHKANLIFGLVNFGPVWILVQSQTTRQTDRKQCIRAHRAYAQVGSKMEKSLFCSFLV